MGGDGSGSAVAAVLTVTAAGDGDGGDGVGDDHPRTCAATGGAAAGASAASAGTSAAGSSTRTTARCSPLPARRARRDGRRGAARRRRRCARRRWRSRRGATRRARAAATAGRRRRPLPSPPPAPGRRQHADRCCASHAASRSQRTVLAEREQREGALAIRRGGGDRAERAAPQPVAEADARAREQLGDRVAVHAHDLRDLVVGQLLQLAQRERLALARRERRVGGADLLLMRLEQRPAAPGRSARSSPDPDRDGGVGDLGGGRRAAPAVDRVVAGVARGSEQVGAELELAARQARQALEHPEERLLRGVGRVVARAGDPVAEVVRAPLVAVVEPREGGAVTCRRPPGEPGLVIGEPGGADPRADGSPSCEARRRPYGRCRRAASVRRPDFRAPRLPLRLPNGLIAGAAPTPPAARTR